MLRPLPFPMPVVVEADDDGGAVIPLLQPRRDDADHAPMPVAAGEHDAPVARRVEDSWSCASACEKRVHLDALALAIVAVQIGGDGNRFRPVVGLEQAQRKHGVAEASAGVEARAEPEADILRGDRKADLADFDKRAHAGPEAVLHLAQTAPDEDAVFLHERDDVGDGAERDEVEIFAQVDLVPLPGSLSSPWQTLKTSPTLAR